MVINECLMDLFRVIHESVRGFYWFVKRVASIFQGRIEEYFDGMTRFILRYLEGLKSVF